MALRVLAISAVLASAPAVAGAAVRFVLRTGEGAPGLPVGATIANVFPPLGGHPRITPNGRVLCFATIANPADQAMYFGGAGQLAIVALRSDASLANPGNLIGSNAFCNDAGDVVFNTRTAQQAIRTHVWRDGSRMLLAGWDQPRPGGGAWDEFYGVFGLSATGYVLLLGESVIGSSNWVMRTNGQFVWSDDAFLGTQAVHPEPHVWTHFSEGRGIGASGRVVTGASFDFAFDHRHAVVALDSAGPHPLLHTLDSAPGFPGVSLVIPGPFMGFTSAGRGFLTSQLAGPGVTAGNDVLTYFYDGAACSVFIREGSPAVGVGPDITWNVTRMSLNAAGAYIGRVELAGAGVTPSSNAAVIVGGAAPPRVLLRTGDTAPGLPPGFVLETLGAESINTHGLAVVVATARSGVMRWPVIYAIDPGATDVRKVIANQDSVRLPSGGAATVFFATASDFLPSFTSGNDDGRPAWLSDTGEIVLIAHIEGAYSIIVVSASPCTADINGDTTVDFLDLNIVLGQYGQTGINLDADINHDGVVNFLDLNILLGEFGRNC